MELIQPSVNPATLRDGRGGIFTYFPVRDSIVEWNLIVTNKGTDRGHHKHKEFDEYIMFVEGHGVYIEKKEDGSEEITQVRTGDCVYFPKNTYHTFIPLTDCKMIAMLTKRWDDCEEPITREV
jgi:mannose-6-phosphate isomerase-like protein (cupin superfamily)